MGDLSQERTLAGGAGAGDRWALAEGDTLGGYRVVRPLGRGGMGEVYLVENIQTGAKCALKLLPPALSDDPTFRERFRREAKIMASLDHPGIVPVRHVAEEGGRYFLTMEYVDGGTLDDRLKADGKLDENETARIALELCDALAYAHGRGVVHRDIKPANVLLDKDGRAKLADFGLARVVGDGFLKSMTERSISLSVARTDGRALSETDNAVIGTYEYMSPEQKAGAPADARSDIFSLGLMVYRMLTGERADGRFPDPSRSGCARLWDVVVDRALASKQLDRYSSVEEVAEDVREAVRMAEADRARREAVESKQAEDEARQRLRDEERERDRAAREVEARRERAAMSTHPATDAGAPDAVYRRVPASPPSVQPPRSHKGLVAVIVLLVLAGGVTEAVLGVQAQREAERWNREVAGEERSHMTTSPITAREGADTLTFDFGGGVTMQLVLIPAGEFMMGSPASEAERGSDESQHRVRITKPFYMGKHEVTQAEYPAVMGTNPSNFKGSDLPVEQVSWNDATEFCRKLSGRSGREVRLPTEAEWEYACRAGTTTPFHFGETISTDQVNCDGRYPYAGGAKGTYRHKTTPVGSLQANAWGLYDMHGNVWEWCADWSGDYEGAASDPTGPANGTSRVLCGGGWANNGYNCRSAYRHGYDPSHRSSGFGFRVVVADIDKK